MFLFRLCAIGIVFVLILPCASAQDKENDARTLIVNCGTSTRLTDGRSKTVTITSSGVYRIDIAGTEIKPQKVFDDVKEFMIVPKGYFLLQKKDGAFCTGNIAQPERLTEVPNMKSISSSWGRALSNNGDKLAAASGRKLNIYDLKTGKMSAVFDKLGHVFFPAWSPDDSQIAFYWNESGSLTSCALMVLDVTECGKDAKQLTPFTRSGMSSMSGGRTLAPRWSPDGKRIIFEGDMRVKREEPFDAWICVVDSDGQNLARFCYGDWSHDSRKVFCVRSEKTDEGTLLRSTTFDVATNTLGKQEGSWKGPIYGWLHTSDGAMVAVKDDDCTIKIIDTQSGNSRVVPEIKCNWPFNDFWWVELQPAGGAPKKEQGARIQRLIQDLEEPGFRIDAALELSKVGDNRGVETLIEILTEGNLRGGRRRAAEALGNIGDKRAIDPLIQSLKDDWKFVRSEAATALGKLGGDEAVEVLIKVLGGNDDWWVRCCAAWALGKTGDRKAVVPLTNALKDERERVRRAVTEALAKLPDKRALESLTGALTDTDKDVRLNAVAALGEIGDSGAVGPLVELLNDEARDIRAAAVRALVKIGDASCAARLRKTWKEDSEEKVRVFAAGALVRLEKNEEALNYLMARLKEVKCSTEPSRPDPVWALGDAGLQAVPRLIEVLKTGEENLTCYWAAKALSLIGEDAVKPLLAALKSEDTCARSYAAVALGWIGDESAIVPLLDVLKDNDGSVRYHAAEALGWIRDRKAVEPLTAVLKDKEALVRRNAAFALGLIGDAAPVPQLIDILEDSDKGVRKAAAWALAKICDERAIDPLIKALKDEYNEVRMGAVSGLGDLRHEKAVGPLIEALKTKDTDIRYSIERALTKITKRRYGIDYEKWKAWYEKNKDK